MRSVRKDKKDNRRKSAQQEEVKDVIEEIEQKHQDTMISQKDKDDSSPYGNYNYANESFEKKSKFGSGKTVTDDKAGFSPDMKGRKLHDGNQ